MSGFANPFAQFGDYRTNAVAKDDIVTTGYLTGLPDPRQIANDQASLIFKQLLKRDSRTKQRALTDLSQWISSVSGEIEDAVHLAYVQMYAKLSIEVSPQVRSESHHVLASLYQNLGKKSAKYLKYSVGPWLAATFDNDTRAAGSAKQALDRIFPGEKQAVLLEKMQQSLVEFIYDSCMNATALTLSDERYVTKEEANQKFTRLVKECLEILINYPQFFTLDSAEIHELVETGRLWKFFCSSDSSAARAALKLAHTHINDLLEFVPVIWKELLRSGRKNAGGSAVALDVIQLMNILTKKFPELIWPADDAEFRKDSMASIAQFVVADPPHPVRFWPLLYNLVLMIPEPPARDLTPLYRPLEKVVLKIRHNAELEDSCWGCFVSLAGKMGPQYAVKVFRTVEQRCKSGNVPLDSIAKFISRITDAPGVKELVVSQLKAGGGDKCPMDYKEILAKTHKFKPEIESLALNADTPVSELAVLAKADGDLSLPHNMHITDDPEWITVAIASQKADSQLIVDSMVGCGFQSLILQNARALRDRGVKDINLDEYVLLNIDDVSVCKVAIQACSIFVSPETCAVALTHLVQRALNDESESRGLLRFIKSEPETVKMLSSIDDSLRHDLETMAVEDSQGIIKQLLGLQVSEVVRVKAAGADFLKSLDIHKLDLAVPEECVVNILRAPIPSGGTPSISTCMDLISHVPKDIDTEHPGNAAKAAVLKQYFDSWVSVATKPKELKSLEIWNDVKIAAPKQELWDLLDSPNYGVAYHAALALANGKPIVADEFTFERSYYTKPSLKGAVLAHFSAVQDNPQYSTLQNTLVREATANRLKASEYMLVDRAFIPESSEVTVNEDDATAVAKILTFGTHVTNLHELAFQSSDRNVEFAALCSLKSADLNEVLEYACNLPQESGLDRLSVYKCLHLVNQHEDEIELAEFTDVIGQLLEGGAFIELNWIALQLIRKAKNDTDFEAELIDVVPLSDEPVSSELVSWLIILNYMPTFPIPDAQLRNMLEWLVPHIKTLSAVKSNRDVAECIVLPDYPPQKTDAVVGNVLYKLCTNQGSSIREWYRDIRDRTFLKQLDTVLSSLVAPNIMRSLKAAAELDEFEDNVEVVVNEKLQEIRARRELEDDVKVEIVISLPEQYPGRPASVEIRNLAAVSEAKKRGWLLEARQNIQNSGILPALHTLLSRLNNYLDGVEPCAICYMMVNDQGKLPNKECSQCHNIYHTDCLYQWFSTNNNKLCPMCRNPI